MLLIMPFHVIYLPFYSGVADAHKVMLCALHDWVIGYNSYSVTLLKLAIFFAEPRPLL